MDFNKEQIIKNKNEAITKLNAYLDKCIIQDQVHSKKANLISYWLKDYINYIEQEENFDSTKLKKYSRGDIIKVNLGFNIGNEEGGLHYCTILDKKNVNSYSTLTIVPLTSLKISSKPNNTSVFLGDEIYQNLLIKYNLLLNNTKSDLNNLNQDLEELQKLPERNENEQIIKEFKINDVNQKIYIAKTNLKLIQKIEKELQQMKTGTIALPNQITTISKQRIYNPKKSIDILSGIRLSKEKLNLIDEKLKKLYIN